MLERLTVDVFAPVVGQPFRVRDPEVGDDLALDLVSAELHDPDRPSIDEHGVRAPFSLVFRGPPDRVLPQRMYVLEHAGVGRAQIFLVPLAAEAGGARYEALFA